eukprot:scaffold20629_cov67-Phaeocystis_antarctica.AAC.2
MRTGSAPGDGPLPRTPALRAPLVSRAVLDIPMSVWRRLLMQLFQPFLQRCELAIAPHPPADVVVPGHYYLLCVSYSQRCRQLDEVVAAAGGRGPGAALCVRSGRYAFEVASSRSSTGHLAQELKGIYMHMHMLGSCCAWGGCKSGIRTEKGARRGRQVCTWGYVQRRRCSAPRPPFWPGLPR